MHGHDYTHTRIFWHPYLATWVDFGLGHELKLIVRICICICLEEMTDWFVKWLVSYLANVD
jgi:hypothetical protein